MPAHTPTAAPGEAATPSRRLSPAAAGLLAAGAFYAFLVFGFNDNLKGPTLPGVQAELNLSYSLAGTILMAARLGFLLAALSMGVLADRAGKKIVLVLAGIFLFAGALGYSTFHSFAGLAAAMLVLGMGFGSVETGANALVVEARLGDRGRLLNLLAMFHSLGSMIAPLVAGFLLQAAYSWRVVYQWALLPTGLLIAWFLWVPYPRPKPAGRGSLAAAGIPGAGLKSAFTPAKAWFYLIITLYVATEVGLASWIVKYLQTEKGFPVVASTGFLSLFYGLIMSGRFLGSFVVERAGYVRSALAAASSAALCILTGLAGPPWAAVFLALSGLCLSIIYPTLTAAVSSLERRNTGSVLGLLFAFGGLGGMLGPWIIGLASDWLGIGLGMGIPLLTCILMAASLGVVARGNG